MFCTYLPECCYTVCVVCAVTALEHSCVLLGEHSDFDKPVQTINNPVWTSLGPFSFWHRTGFFCGSNTVFFLFLRSLGGQSQSFLLSECITEDLFLSDTVQGSWVPSAQSLLPSWWITDDFLISDTVLESLVVQSQFFLYLMDKDLLEAGSILRFLWESFNSTKDTTCLVYIILFCILIMTFLYKLQFSKF